MTRSEEIAACRLCGEPMPPNEQMFQYHGYSGPCPVPSAPAVSSTSNLPADVERALESPWVTPFSLKELLRRESTRLRVALADVARLTEQRDMMDQAHEIEMQTHLSTLARAALAAAVAEEREAILGMVCEAGEPTCCNLPVETIGTYGPEQECCGSPIYSITDLKPLTDAIRARAAKEGS